MLPLLTVTPLVVNILHSNLSVLASAEAINYQLTQN